MNLATIGWVAALTIAAGWSGYGYGRMRLRQSQKPAAEMVADMTGEELLRLLTAWNPTYDSYNHEWDSYVKDPITTARISLSAKTLHELVDKRLQIEAKHSLIRVVL